MYRYLVRIEFRNGIADEYVQAFDVNGQPITTPDEDAAHLYPHEIAAHHAARNAENARNWSESEWVPADRCAASVVPVEIVK